MRRIILRRRQVRALYRLWCFSLILLTIGVATAYFFEKSEPKIELLAKNSAETQITLVVTEKAAEADLRDAVKITTADDGHITSMNIDAGMLNTAAAEISAGIIKELEDNPVTIKIPVGDLLGEAILSGQGPRISVRLTNYSSLKCSITPSGREAGINQCAYTVTLDISIRVLMILPGGENSEIEVNCSVPLTINIIVGEVPIYAH